MAGGGVLGVLGVPMPAVETGIALSAVVLGLMVALAARPPLWVAAVIVGAFAVFHGYAHGAELPAAADPVAFSVGFVIATGLLHLLGIAIGLLVRWPTEDRPASDRPTIALAWSCSLSDQVRGRSLYRCPPPASGAASAHGVVAAAKASMPAYSISNRAISMSSCC